MYMITMGISPARDHSTLGGSGHRRPQCCCAWSPPTQRLAADGGWPRGAWRTAKPKPLSFQLYDVLGSTKTVAWQLSCECKTMRFSNLLKHVKPFLANVARSPGVDTPQARGFFSKIWLWALPFHKVIYIDTDILTLGCHSPRLFWYSAQQKNPCHVCWLLISCIL